MGQATWPHAQDEIPGARWSRRGFLLKLIGDNLIRIPKLLAQRG